MQRGNFMSSCLVKGKTGLPALWGLYHFQKGFVCSSQCADINWWDRLIWTWFNIYYTPIPEKSTKFVLSKVLFTDDIAELAARHHNWRGLWIMWHDKQCKLQTHWWTWILHMWEASILVQTQELCPASSNKRLENRRCHQSASGHQWSSASAFAASPTAAVTLVHIAICNSVKHALRNRILFSFPPGLVWSIPQ